VDTVDKAIVNKLLISRHDNIVGDQDFAVFATVSIASTVTSTIASMSLFLGAIAAVSLILGAVGIANTMFTSVLGKTREIGTMKAIGAKNKDILMIFLFNSAMVSLVGGILGVILGTFVSSGLQAMMGMTS
jgi:putative ABC transport system permease protein